MRIPLPVRRLRRVVPFLMLAGCSTAGDRFSDSAAGAVADSAAAGGSPAGTTGFGANGAAGTSTGAPVGASTSASASAAGRPRDSTPEINADAMHAGAATASAARRAPPADSNQAFLRAMADHHHGLVVLVDSTAAKLGAIRVDADSLQQQQRRRRDDMMQMLNTEYDDPITPAMVPGNRAMIDAVARAGNGAGRTFYQQVVAQHREGVRVIDRYLPYLSGKQKAMATTMRADHLRQIDAYQRKASATP